MIQSAILVIVLAILFPATLFRGHALLPAGYLFEHPPWNAYTADEAQPAENRAAVDALRTVCKDYAVAAWALRHGDWPLWNPLEAGGKPLLADCRAAVLYPPRLLLAVLDPVEAATLFILLKLWICGMTAYLCARTFRLGIPAARFASIGWMVSGYAMASSYGPETDAAAWIPALIAAAELMLEGRRRAGFFTAASAATLLLLAGAPGAACASAAAFAVYFLCRIAGGVESGAPRLPGARLKAAGLMAAAWILAALVTAPQTFPFAECLARPDAFASGLGA
ncbi:MAG: hypothetical protein JXR94_14125, partial [Candidatus Hydrogenedentes bacterium]|nr:hypothetical protein [Candidatus Hydrogenedentota bacterium]